MKRPFQAAAEICCRGYSLPLQRVITDFRVDNAFGQVPGKLKEHYGIALSESAATTITEKHARAVTETVMTPVIRPTAEPLTLVVETDGLSLIHI